MIEYTKTKTVKEIKAFGYKDAGIYEANSKKLNELIFKATVNGEYDLILLIIDETEGREIYHVFFSHRKQGT